jgi:hypothetical protein
MKSKRILRKKTRRSRKNKRGGGMFDFLFGKSATPTTTTTPVTPVTPTTPSVVDTSSVIPESAVCDYSNITELTTPEEMHKKYQSCCPKSRLGFKNTSPYCKQIELNFKSNLKGQNDANEYKGYEPEEEYNMKQQPDIYTPVGGRRRKGKRTRRHKRKN